MKFTYVYGLDDSNHKRDTFEYVEACSHAEANQIMKERFPLRPEPEPYVFQPTYEHYVLDAVRCGPILIWGGDYFL